MRNPTFQLILKATLAVGLVCALILLSAAVTSTAARNALPGDALYGLKTGLEQAQLRFSATAAKQARFQLRLSELRLDEMKELLAESRYADIPETAAAFQEHIGAALELAKQVSGEDASLASELSVDINQMLALYAVTLGSLLENLPAEARAALESALQSLPSSGSSPSDDGNANENDDDGNENDANENDDDGNENDANENDNDDGNENDANENDDDDGNVNDNDDGNENDDDDGNENDANENDDDGNVNDNDDGNENDANENDDDGNENDDNGNENDDDDGNENDGDDGNENDGDDGNENDGDDGNENDDDDGNENDDDDGNENDDDDGNENDDGDDD
jgi:hypothetical protein